MPSTPSSRNGGNSRPNGDEGMIPESTVFEFLTRMPATSNSLSWIVQFREALLLLFPDISRISISVNTGCDLVNPSAYSTDISIVEHMADELATVGDVNVQVIESNEPPSLQLLADFKAKGYPLEQFHEPVAIDYYIQDTAYVGTLFLWVVRSETPLPASTIERFRTLDPFIRFALSDLVARSQNSRPFDRAFNIALKQMTTDAQLSPQERRVVMLQLYGHKYEEIAERMLISKETVRKHIQSIYRKTGTKSNIELFAKYFTPRIGF
jgi:DNA-binding CsgD family transcriptional regulator